jgi:hypothetical protein
MAMAGFYTIQSSRIVFGRDGEWYADGARIENRRIADLFARSVRRRDGGGYELCIAEERAAIEVEDTAYVVRGVFGDGGQLAVELNDASAEKLDAASLAVGSGNVLYCKVKAGAEWARFTRPAYHQLASSIREIAPGRFALEMGGRVHVIGKR